MRSHVFSSVNHSEVLRTSAEFMQRLLPSLFIAGCAALDNGLARTPQVLLLT